MNKTKKATIFMIALIALFFMPIVYAQYNYDHVNVTTRVNITNAFPEIQSVLVDQDITLVAGGYKTVYCNTTIRDWNGWDDIDFVNATLYHSTSTSEAVDSGNNHYTNTSCLNTGDDGEYLSYYECSFNLIHYANSNSWTCNVTAQDLYGFTDYMTNTTMVNELYALNVTDVIDYGNLAVTDTSLEVTATITNFGNMNINVSVLGYGAVEGDTYGLICERGGNIGVQYQRFSPVASLWEDKTTLAATNQDLRLTILQATDLTTPTLWTTYWQLYVPPNPQGECSGTIRFTATATN